MPRWSSSLVSVLLLAALSAGAQTFVYSGREYLQRGTSWPQLREVDATTGHQVHLTNTLRTHWEPWCSPDGRSILFTSNTGMETSLYRYDRITKAEDLVISSRAAGLYTVVGAIDQSRILVDERGAIAIIDINKKQETRRIEGVNPALSPDRALFAWQTPMENPVTPSPQSHVYISATNGGGQSDIGEGVTPAFTPDGLGLIFVRFDQASRHLNLVRFDLSSKREQIQATAAPEDFFQPYNLTVSPDASTILLAGCCGDHGSALYWRLKSDHEWSLIDENLDTWGGWSQSGLLIYSNDGHGLRPLDEKRTVWVGDVKVFDSHTGKTRVMVSGTSLNNGPRWCGGSGKAP